MSSYKCYKTISIEDTEMIYSLLREKHPEKQINIEYDDNSKEYKIILTNLIYKSDPDVIINVDIKVIYGDSVTGDTPLLLKKDDKIYIETINNIFDEKKKIEYPGFKIFDKTIRLEKEYSTTDYKIWSDKGWVSIKKVIRHKCNKKIFKILTNTGCVKVTEDHSLLDENISIIKPKECNLETKLLNSYPVIFNENYDLISKNKAFIYGFFLRNGMCDKSSGLWELSSIDISILINLKNLVKKEYIDSNIIIHRNSCGYYKLSINNSENMVKEYRYKFYDIEYKKVPVEILNSNNEIIKTFCDGYFACNGCKKDKEETEFINIDNKSQIGTAGLYYLMKKLGYNVLITKDDKKIIITKNKHIEISNKIKKIELLEENFNDYVYDIETDIGRFQAGVGDIIVKNTDSIFLELKFNREDFVKNRQDTFKLAELCGENITHKIFNRQPVVLEFEKVFQPFILLTKKRYIGKKYEDMQDPFKLKAIIKSGIAVTRRDYCKMVKKCYTQVIDCIVDENNDSIDNISQSIELYKSYVDKIDNYQIDQSDLIISAMLAKSYKTRPVHLQLAEKLKQRKEEIQIGERVQYIYIENTSSEIKKKSELGEDPEYAKKNGLKYNRGCYLTQLAKPLLGFFLVILVNHQELLEDLIEMTNNKLLEYNEPRLKKSDYLLPISKDEEIE